MIKDNAEEFARLYSEGYTYTQIAQIYNANHSTIRQHVRKLRNMGLFNISDDKRERALLKRSCAEHLADLHRHHGYRVRTKAA